MGEKGKSWREKTEAFEIPAAIFRRLIKDRSYSIACLAPLIFHHYVKEYESDIQRKIKRACNKPKAYESLISKIIDLNKNTKGYAKVPFECKKITIPSANVFFSSVFPTIDTTKQRTGTIRVNTHYGVLSELDYAAELENIVDNHDMVVEYMALAEETQVCINEALGRFKIYSVPTEQEDDDPQVTVAIRVFQNEYMGIQLDETTGTLDYETLLQINLALTEEWTRFPYYERVDQTDYTRYYFPQLKIRPIVPRFNQQGDPWLDFPGGDWGDEPLPLRPQNEQRTLTQAGCAVAFVANMAFTHRQRLIANGSLPALTPGINHITLEEDQNLVTPGTIVGVENNFDTGGIIFWNRPLLAFSPTFPLPPSNQTYRPRRWNENISTLQVTGEPQLAANWLEANLNARQGQFYVAIRIFTTNAFPHATGQHWVGLNEVVIRGGNTFYRISPTSVNDRGHFADRAGRGWQFLPAPAPANPGGPHNDPIDIYIPATEVAEYRIFAIPAGE